MSEAITINGVDYLYYIRTGELFILRASGLPAGGAVRVPVKRSSRTFRNVLDALAAGSAA